MNAQTPSSRRATASTRAFTLIELLVVIAIIALLAAILFPVFGRARENARRSSCQSNLKQISLGILQYTQDFDEFYPIDRGAPNTSFSYTEVFDRTRYGWPSRVMPYIKSEQLFICPATTASSGNLANTRVDQTTSYWTPEIPFRTPKDTPVAVAAITKPAETPHIYDNPNGTYEGRRVFRPYWNGTIYTDIGSFSTSKPATHFDGMNCAYVDGHVKWQKLTSLFKQLCPEWVDGGTSISCSLPTNM